ncbi:homeobox protein ceh-38-like isoform X1 [Montipora capricornis]|uniref:homeobox protein ceh-38-like isoform X1 n=1 Tax=Montipora capricornis TaxID=246305 RepID=UPI0035F1B954
MIDGENSSTNLVSSPSDTAVQLQELDPLTLGASEEVNTSTVCGGKRNNSHRSKTNVGVEKFIPGVLYLRKKSPLNSPYNLTFNEHSMENELELNVNYSLKEEADDLTSNCASVEGKTNETRRDEANTEASGITTTVVSEGLSFMESTRGIVIVEDVALDQIHEFITDHAANIQDHNPSNNVLFECQSVRRRRTSEDKKYSQPIGSSENCELRGSLHVTTSSSETLDKESSEIFRKRFEDLDTKEIAEALTNELKKYSIPQAVFARKVLNRSQGTLSDVLRKPKPWNELRGGREIFRKMKEWLDLPEVKRIPQLRTEAALELDAKARRPDLNGHGSKKSRLHFTASQKRALFAIFKETKKPSKEMQNALAEELGLERGTVANFFMNARRRHPDV